MSAETIESQLTGIRKDVSYMGKQLDKVEGLLEENYVTSDQHALLVDRVNNIQKVVFGFVGIILIGFATVAVNFFISGGGL